MSEKDWADFLVSAEKKGSSGLPSDDFTFTDGSNGGLDGFYFDLEMNKGVEDAARLPETQGLSGLPDGIITADDEEPLVFADIMGNDDGPDLLDIELIDAPEDTSDLGLDEEAKLASLTNLDWLTDEQTQDVDRLPQMPAIIQDLSTQWGTGKSTDGGYLVPNSETVQVWKPEKGSELPGDPTRVRASIMRAGRRVHYGDGIREIAAELVKVAGVEMTKKVVAQLQKDIGLAGKVFIRASVFPGLKNGKWSKELKKVARTARYVITDDPVVASKLSKVMVDEIPWKEALNHYMPRLKAAGYKISSGDPQEVLRSAFLSGPAKTKKTESYKPVYTPKEATDEQVKEALSVKPKVVVPKTAEQVAIDAKQKQVLIKMARWVKAGQLSQKDALEIYNSGVTPIQMLKKAAEIITTTDRSTTYMGSGTLFSEEAQTQRQVSTSSITTGNVQSVLKWAKEQMNEGMAGKLLDGMLAGKFSKAVLVAAEEQLKELRKAHEGLAGFMYVDAEAYASPAGSTGCENGALKHRANGIKIVKAMDRCSSCVFANADQVCSQYNKRLLSFGKNEKLAARQKANIKLANADDSEKTAALFNPDEYNLQGQMNVEIDPEVSTEKLSGILFEGIELED